MAIGLRPAPRRQAEGVRVHGRLAPSARRGDVLGIVDGQDEIRDELTGRSRAGSPRLPERGPWASPEGRCRDEGRCPGAVCSEAQFVRPSSPEHAWFELFAACQSHLRVTTAPVSLEFLGAVKLLAHPAQRGDSPFCEECACPRGGKNHSCRRRRDGSRRPDEADSPNRRVFLNDAEI